MSKEGYTVNSFYSRRFEVISSTLRLLRLRDIRDSTEATRELIKEHDRAYVECDKLINLTDSVNK